VVDCEKYILSLPLRSWGCAVLEFIPPPDIAEILENSGTPTKSKDKWLAVVELPADSSLDWNDN
jgi:hypothetical protein